MCLCSPGVDALDEAAKLEIYIRIYAMALVIPVVSVAGVLLGGTLKRREIRRLRGHGIERAKAEEYGAWPALSAPRPTGGFWAAAWCSWSSPSRMGLAEVPYNQEIIFAGSMLIILFLISRLLKVLEPAARNVLLGTAIIIFVYRAMPTPGAGQTWWMIDELGFDQQFLSVLSLISSALALFGMFIFRRFMAEKSIAYIVVFLTLISTLLTFPIIGMYYGLHDWTAAHTGGIVDAHFIALVDTAIESPLGQVAMIPMLAWIANSAPAKLKATFFAVMASFTNLALSASTLGTKYINKYLHRYPRGQGPGDRRGYPTGRLLGTRLADDHGGGTDLPAAVDGDPAGEDDTPAQCLSRHRGGRAVAATSLAAIITFIVLVVLR